ncbi:3-phosphoshikimate 1-carboxyvinyltransferase [Flavilitoribacter nigricans]|uniref:3-phosphoshikimate 1-carboxyvinyltransferase n=1 Tax=Flavilitoribacter nigricans (strain ATCC 23147 / DSM 23189 / NBRC 102662 / NCIMB 1420 / SS-2) TaxID=1122177 RepID=A0A2D0N0M4_FLAN2|nr:3-phosphoshikimate 1-carboxyvinyltransferase [Flavilitoribacter nigricans]PHN01928.1 3-phosphoshikimate 1-carboxyvinyltransferase [Flavilitoribacter nigricans DSM 23189 = NBRC 102662]
MTYQLNKTDRKISGTLSLTGSKSISNRALLIRALCEEPFEINRLAAANDTELMEALIASSDEVRDAGPAGTTFRFLTAYLSLQPGTQILTGTERMKQRPIGVLVEALRSLGANIEYLEKDGYPPLKIGEAETLGSNNQLSISAATSSQYISALLMIAPVLPNGLELTLEGNIVSRSYIEMTLGLMRYFGVTAEWDGNTVKVAPQKYQARDFTVEADWSAASYHYALAAFADELDLQLDGLFPESTQGDAALVPIMEQFGIQSTFNETGVRLTKSGKEPTQMFEWDFILCPDIAQTMAVICAGLGVQGLFSGLETLSIKETDRIKALQVELGKVQAYFSKLPPRFSPNSQKQYFMVEGKADLTNTPAFDTYEDHRMAMAFAPLAMYGTILINEPMVVEKSYPHFYEDLEFLGFTVKR